MKKATAPTTYLYHAAFDPNKLDDVATLEVGIFDSGQSIGSHIIQLDLPNGNRLQPNFEKLLAPVPTLGGTIEPRLRGKMYEDGWSGWYDINVQ